jgi:hypothetical protein
MQETVQAILGALAALLVGVVVIGALAVLIVVEGYHLVGFGTRLYWRCKESLRQFRSEAAAPMLPQHDQASRGLDRPSTPQPPRMPPDWDGGRGTPPNNADPRLSGDE